MQYLYQKKNGERVPCPKSAYDEMRMRYKKQVTTIISEKSLVVFCLGKPNNCPPEKLRYGGGPSQRNPYDHLQNARPTGLSNWAVDNL